MEQKVEVFDCREMAGAGIMSDERVIELVATGLFKGQWQYVKKDDNDAMSVVSYREMNMEEKAVYETLLPTKIKVWQYSASPMPARIMELAQELAGDFKEIEVWHQRSEVKDPILVGIRNGENSWERSCFLIARWGEELLPFSVLREKAKAILLRDWKSHGKIALEGIRAFLDSLDEHVDEHLSGNHQPTPW